MFFFFRLSKWFFSVCSRSYWMQINWLHRQLHAIYGHFKPLSHPNTFKLFMIYFLLYNSVVSISGWLPFVRSVNSSAIFVLRSIFIPTFRCFSECNISLCCLLPPMVAHYFYTFAKQCKMTPITKVIKSDSSTRIPR